MLILSLCLCMNALSPCTQRAGPTHQTIPAVLSSDPVLVQGGHFDFTGSVRSKCMFCVYAALGCQDLQQANHHGCFLEHQMQSNSSALLSCRTAKSPRLAACLSMLLARSRSGQASVVYGCFLCCMLQLQLYAGRVACQPMNIILFKAGLSDSVRELDLSPLCWQLPLSQSNRLQSVPHI